ncbi:hypothetical protein ABIC94_002124 [Variovorax paradoxus]|uniref:hypothetical protein n=1 Tax=Variovorax paradoxus TaxID=34073 RepID=UPI003397DB27
MKAHNIEVFARDGEVVVRQESPYAEDAVGDGFDTVVLTPEQAGAVCRWIMQAARELSLQVKVAGELSQ